MNIIFIRGCVLIPEWGSEESEDEEEEEDEDATPGPSQTAASDSSDSDPDAERCPICLARLRDQNVGTPESCDHSFCLECIQEWAKVRQSLLLLRPVECVESCCTCKPPL